MTETQQQGIGEQMKAAVMQAALDGEEDSSGVALANTEKRSFVKGGAPGPGRPKGSQNKTLRTIREAVEAASQPGACHDGGLAGWLIDRARGGLGDRQIFAQMVSKAMPLQVQANVDGGIRLELSWLGSRQIGTTQTQTLEQVTQVVDLERDSKGKYRIADQNTTDGTAPEALGGVDGA